MASAIRATGPSSTDSLRQSNDKDQNNDSHEFTADTTMEHSTADEKGSTGSSSSELDERLLAEVRALESQQRNPQSDAENQFSRRKKIMLVALYLFLGVALTLSSKSILNKLNLPWLLTAAHATATSVCCFALVCSGHLTLTPLGVRERFVLLGLSVLFTLSIGISNVSLTMVSVPLHQVLRSTSPVAMVLIYGFADAQSRSLATYASLVPLMLGAFMTAVGEYQVSLLGVILTVFGVLLACISSITANRFVEEPLALSPLELLLHLSPLAVMQCLGYAALAGELTTLRRFCQLGGGFTWSFGLAIFVNALVAFALNYVPIRSDQSISVRAIKARGAVKHALTIIFGVVLFDAPLGMINGAGMCMAIVGAAWFSKVETAKDETPGE